MIDAMSEEASFRDLIVRIRAGDGPAATELVRRYEPAIRRAVRLRLRDERMRRVLDSMDICQSVLASFFIRAATGQYEMDTPDQLLKLLATMARNKVADQVDQQRAARRDNRRVEAGSAEERDVAGREATPSHYVAVQEILEETRRRLSPEELRLLDWRQQGREWVEIAAEVGGSPEALRKKLTRAVDRVAQELGLGEVSHE